MVGHGRKRNGGFGVTKGNRRTLAHRFAMIYKSPLNATKHYAMHDAQWSFGTSDGSLTAPASSALAKWKLQVGING